MDDEEPKLFGSYAGDDEAQNTHESFKEHPIDLKEGRKGSQKETWVRVCANGVFRDSGGYNMKDDPLTATLAALPSPLERPVRLVSLAGLWLVMP